MTNTGKLFARVIALVLPLTLGQACSMRRDWGVCNLDVPNCRPGFQCNFARSKCEPIFDGGVKDGESGALSIDTLASTGLDVGLPELPMSSSGGAGAADAGSAVGGSGGVGGTGGVGSAGDNTGGAAGGVTRNAGGTPGGNTNTGGLSIGSGGSDAGGRASTSAGGGTSAGPTGGGRSSSAGGSSGGEMTSLGGGGVTTGSGGIGTGGTSGGSGAPDAAIDGALPTVPVITTFTASATTISAGKTTTLSWVVTGATNISIDQGIGDVTGTSKLVEPSQTTLYTLTAQNTAGASRLQLLINVVAAPTIASFTATPSTISVGATSQLTATFSGAATATISGGIGIASSGIAVATGALSTTTTYTLTVADAAGGSVSKDVTVTVVALPTISSFVAAPPSISLGAMTTLTAIFAGGTGAIDKGVGGVTSGTGVATPALSSRTTFTLTVTNPAGATATQQVAVTVQGFVATGSMNDARSSATATKLPNGKVLIAGGMGSAGYLNSAELYDPSTKVFTRTGSMSTARLYHAAVLLNTGLVLVGGGERSGSSSRSTGELYDPATGTFTMVAQVMNGQRQGSPTMTLLPSGKVLVAGGTSTDSYAELFDPLLGVNGTFGSVAAAMTVARDMHTATLLSSGRFQGKVLLAGNASAGTNTGDLYDPTGENNGTFAAVDNTMAEGRCNAGAVALPGGKVLLVGGQNIIGTTRSVVLYDSSVGTNGTFSTENPVSVVRITPSTVLLTTGKVLVAGGASDRSADLYDPTTGTVKSAGTMVVQRRYQMTVELDNGQVLIAGGVDTTTAPTATAELYVY
jgi:hypothetical protein